MNFQSMQWLANSFCILPSVFREAVWPWILIGDSQTSTCVHVLDRVPIVAQFADQLCHPLHRCRKRLHRGDLRPDVHADPGNLQEETVRSAGIEAARFAYGNSKFVLVQSG